MRAPLEGGCHSGGTSSKTRHTPARIAQDMQTPSPVPAPRDPRRERLLGIALMCGAVLCFSGLDSTAKILSSSLPTEQVVWARYLSNVILVAAIVNPVSRPGALRSRRPGLQLLRSATLFASTLLNFLALRHLQLAETVSISFATPLLVAILAAPLLGERVGRTRLAAIVVGFVGVLVVVRPGTGAMHPAAIFSVLGCFCYAGYALMTRKLAAYDRAETTLVYSGLAGVILLTPLLPSFWTWPVGPLGWVLMASMGVYATVGHFMMIKAHQFAPASVLSPFMYTQLLWMVVLGWVLFGDVPDRITLVGALIVVASGLFLITRERRRAA